MGNLGLMEILLVLIAIVPGGVLTVGGILGFLAFRKVSALEKALKARNLL
ncbi:hypothetical protein GETHLI_02510 [Geothrix limicola]|uniref:Uncharacterized protein n=1 Tax=Geothrix limicola TaxID=2927978 RepID=A0ABQ5QB25_9BACT|nr:hypothetical protein [Geothrix limicola]GLH71749.1 hypothetical protein GETHLI_02510 [Geothrix limicola]